MTKLILTDCDGVLLDWETRFSQWMKERGFKPVVRNYKSLYNIAKRYDISQDEKIDLISEFNESDEMFSLNAFRDAKEIVSIINQQHGYKFHVISSMSDSPSARDKRIHNLETIFGKEAFHDYTFLGVGENKNDCLNSYSNSGLLWIEDSIKNYELGKKVGLRSCLMTHAYNKHHETPNKIRNWNDFMRRHFDNVGG